MRCCVACWSGVLQCCLTRSGNGSERCSVRHSTRGGGPVRIVTRAYGSGQLTFGHAARGENVLLLFAWLPKTRSFVLCQLR
jgi:hypothetical protein